MITVEQLCIDCATTTRWYSQELIASNSIPLGNIQLSTAMISTGAIPLRFLRTLDFWGLYGINPSTYFNHQRRFIHQAVRNLWEDESIDCLAKLEDSVQFSGDARCDSMGHCAKYGSYSLHDTDLNKIVAMELVQVSEVKNSYHMELEGLDRALTYVEQALPHVQIKLTTDGHKSIAKWLREDKSETITHYLDIWHVAKGITKKLKTLKKCPLVDQWQGSIVNHLYWCVKTIGDNVDERIEKWKSVANHIANIHKHESKLFPKCLHSHRVCKRGRKKKWFEAGSEDHDKLCKVLLNKDLLKSVAKLSPQGQTSGLEGYHSCLLHFCPKMYHFGYNAMTSRLQIAAMHFNENAGRDQGITKDGKPYFNMTNPRSRERRSIVVPVKGSNI
ncbi:uncharacterized protein LOC135486686 [Lineus longissimus]|uniref:uncharacterized protein LOC135486686 n=1 Tax=Lineus longissimus TaxID=88925 RepID=UPI00315D71AC